MSNQQREAIIEGVEQRLDQKVSREVRKAIIAQYTECTRLLNELFNYAPDMCWAEDGLGCCNYPTETVEFSLAGPAFFTLMNMYAARIAEEGLRYKDSLQPPCSYHKPGVGCILGELKPPVCISGYCKSGLDGLDYDPKYVFAALKQILLASPDEQTGTWHPERNRPMVEEFKSYINVLLEKVKAKKAV